MSGKNVLVRSASTSAVLVAVFGISLTVLTAAAADQSPSPPVPATSAPPSAPATVTPPGTDATSPAPQDENSVELRAKEWLGRLQKGQLDRTQLTPDLSAGLQDATVAALSKQLSPLGAPQHLVLRTKHQLDGITTWTFRVTWPEQTLDYTFGVEDGSGKISALYLRPDSPA